MTKTKTETKMVLNGMGGWGGGGGREGQTNTTGVCLQAVGARQSR